MTITQSDTAIGALRKKPAYRLLESLLGISALGFIIGMVVLSLFAPQIAALFLILYSFAWLLRVTLIASYTLSSYQNVMRWQAIDATALIHTLSSGRAKGKEALIALHSKHLSRRNWNKTCASFLVEYEHIGHTKYEKIDEIYHIPIFSVYNESSEVLIRSLQAIYDAHYRRDRIIVVVTQEQRAGDELIGQVRSDIGKLEWVSTRVFQENDLDIVYANNHAELPYTSPTGMPDPLSDTKLNIIFTAHPDGLTGEIKGKASNEDWAGRQASLFLKTCDIDPDTAIVTSLDADSSVNTEFFSLLSLRYCLSPKDIKCGFQAIPIYTKNIYETALLPRIVAFNTSTWQIALNSLEGRTTFFANYCVPMTVLQEVDFWEREFIGEDFMFYAKCLVHYQGKFVVRPFFGQFNGDAVVGDDYLQGIENQYKQLQRWSWGGVEGFPYIIRRLFWEKNQIPLGQRALFVFETFANHHFWSTAPLAFGIGTYLPFFLGGSAFTQSQAATELLLFSQYFAWVSYIFIAAYTWLGYSILVRTAAAHSHLKHPLYNFALVALQSCVMPFIQLFSTLPALDAQIRGMQGKYLGYWVTPKK
jgi:hypothetical protein